MNLRQSMDGSSRKMLAGLDLSFECNNFSMVGNPSITELGKSSPLSRSRTLQITLTTQAVIGKTRDDGCSEAYSHPKRAAYHRSHHVATSVTMIFDLTLTSSSGEQRDFLHLDLESRPFITSNSKAIRYPRRYVAQARRRVDGLFFK